ncbi:MAG: hypothetical protein ABF379_03490 [Akkermansiaceae bacterium]|jgi:hypothetical protein
MRQFKISINSGFCAHRLLAVAAIVTACHVAAAQEALVELEAATLLKSIDGKLIDTEYFSVPTIADIDGDGKNDIVVGQFMNCQRPGGGSAGSVRWYRNESKNDELPTYTSGVDLKSESGLVYADNW